MMRIKTYGLQTLAYLAAFWIPSAIAFAHTCINPSMSNIGAALFLAIMGSIIVFLLHGPF